jgi:hypothetical protein
MLLSWNNLSYYQDLMGHPRALEEGRFADSWPDPGHVGEGRYRGAITTLMPLWLQMPQLSVSTVILTPLITYNVSRAGASDRRPPGPLPIVLSEISTSDGPGCRPTIWSGQGMIAGDRPAMLGGHADHVSRASIGKRALISGRGKGNEPFSIVVQKTEIWPEIANRATSVLIIGKCRLGQTKERESRSEEVLEVRHAWQFPSGFQLLLKQV